MDPENTRKETEKNGKTEKKRNNHKKNGRRIIFAFVLAIILLWLLQFVSVMSDYIITLALREMDPTFRAGITTAVDNVGNILDSQKNDVKENLLMDTHIKSTSLKNSFKGEASGKLMCNDDGFTVRVLDDKVVLPEEEGFGVPDELTPDLFSDEYGTFDANYSDMHAAYAYSHISGDYYYVECGYNEWMYSELVDSLLASVAKAYNRSIVFADKNDTVIYRSDELYDLTDKEFKAVMSAENEINPIVYGSKTASVFRVDSSEGDYYAILFSPQYSEIRNTGQMVLLVTLICALLLGTIMVWLIEIRRAIGNTSLSKAKMEKYRPQIMKKRLMIISLLCMIIILAAGYVSNSIDNLYNSTVKAKSTLSSVSSLIDSTKTDISVSSDDGRYDWTSKATAVADALSANPDLRNSKSLREFSDILYADYMIVYDHNGNELLTDSDYIGLSLGKDEKSQTYDFRKLLHGERSIIHDPAPDEMSGEDMVLIGARMDSIEEDHPDGYNALVIAFRPNVLATQVSSIDAERLLDILGSEENVFCMVNKESKNIEFFTDYGLASQSALDLGMEESELRGGFMGVFSLNNLKYFGLSVEDGNSLIYYAIPATQLYEGSLLFGFINAILFSVILRLMYRILMKGYKEQYDEMIINAPLNDPNDTNSVVLSDGRVKESVDPSRRWMLEPLRKFLRTPEKKAELVFRMLLGICVLLIVCQSIRGMKSSESTAGLIPFLFSDKWAKGFNLFALSRILIMLSTVLVVWSVIVFAVRLVCGLFGTKGETISRLVRSMCGYGAIFYAVYFTALYLGLDPNALLASVGIVGLAVSFGARDLVADVLAGMYIVFEGEFQVGDIVEIEGYRGTVQEIGIRTTKLLGQGDNIKVISNSMIKNVINLTRRHSWCDVSFNLDYSVPYEEIRKIMQDELPGVAERHPEILSTPYFKGITAFNPGKMTLEVQAECLEADFYRVRRILNGEIRMIMEKHEIKMQ